MWFYNLLLFFKLAFMTFLGKVCTERTNLEDLKRIRRMQQNYNCNGEMYLLPTCTSYELYLETLATNKKKLFILLLIQIFKTTFSHKTSRDLSELGVLDEVKLCSTSGFIHSKVLKKSCSKSNFGFFVLFLWMNESLSWESFKVKSFGSEFDPSFESRNDYQLLFILHFLLSSWRYCGGNLKSKKNFWWFA